ncbi:MAG: hypothetical protein OXG82_08220 [Gammaproteobacteria bacterium]|nr:hypothetical protein [Gammaproteobacteria bacterium]
MAPAVPQRLCEEVLASVDGALAFALVDLQTGLPLAMGANPAATFDPAATEMLAALGVSYFDSSTSTDELGDDVIRELQATTDDAYLFMVRVPEAPNELAVLAMDRKATNLGLGWMATRQAMQRIQALGDEESGAAMPVDAWPVSGRAEQSPPPRTFARRRRIRRSIWD